MLDRHWRGAGWRDEVPKGRQWWENQGVSRRSAWVGPVQLPDERWEAQGEDGRQHHRGYWPGPGNGQSPTRSWRAGWSGVYLGRKEHRDGVSMPRRRGSLPWGQQRVKCRCGERGCREIRTWSHSRDRAL